MWTNLWFEVQTGDHSPDEVTPALGVAADKIERRGEPRSLLRTQHTAQVAQRNRWILETRLPKEARPEDHLDNMRVRVAPHLDALGGLRERGHVVRLVVVAYIPSDEQSEEWTLDAGTVAWIAACGASVETAVYAISPDG